MPVPRLISIVDPALLLQRAVEGLFPLPPRSGVQPWPTLPAWIVLRQGGLRDDLHRLAASRGVAGWFDPPICLFNELPERWGARDGRRALTDPERHAILSGLLDRFGGAVFGRASGAEAWVPAVDRLIGELVSEGIDAEDFERALRESAADAFARERADALARIYAEWPLALEDAGRSDGRDGKVRVAAEIAADPAGFAERLGGRRDVRIVGLADLRGGWRRLISVLAESPALDRLEILTSFPLELPGDVQVEHAAPEAAATFAGALFRQGTFTAPAVRLIEAPDAAREVELIAVRVRALLDGGVPPSRIAVVAREARPLVNELSMALARVGVPVTARRRTGLAHTAPARALRAMLSAASESWSRHSMVELAENPLLATGLDAAVVNFVGFVRPVATRAGWREGLAGLLARCEARARGDDRDDGHPQPLPPAEHVTATIAAWNALEPRLADLESARPLAEWYRWVAAALDDASWGLPEALARPLADGEVWRADLRARDLIAEYALAWHAALSTFGVDAKPIRADVFAEALQLLLEQDLITPPATDFGVVVAEALAAGWRGFDHVFLVGLSAGDFPRRPASGGLLDRDDRRALIAAGLAIDERDAWRAREAELFRVICAAPSATLTLSWPMMDGAGREVARSAFADEAAAALARALAIADDDEALAQAGVLERVPASAVLVPGYPVANDAGAIAHARDVSARERARGRRADPWNGLIEDPALKAWLALRYGEAFVWSATQLEQAAKCRWHWFGQRLLRLDPRGDPDDLMEASVRGSIMHDALARFFTAAKTRVGGPVYLTEDRGGQWAGLLSASLGEAWNAAASAGEWLGPEPLRPVARRELEADLLAYLKFELDWNVKSSKAGTNSAKQIRTGFVEGELRFDDVVLAGDGVTFRLRGSIDRVDQGVDDRVPASSRYIAAIDYKSTASSTPAAGEQEGWDDGVVLQVPLYAAALQKLRPDDLVARLEYRTLRSPKAVHTLSLAPLKGGEVQDAPEAEEKLAGALDAAGRWVAAVRRGELPADPAPSCGCSPYCPARDICRIPGGPVEAER